jgi:ribonucleoside-diphosphate reductase alpha chain
MNDQFMADSESKATISTNKNFYQQVLDKRSKTKPTDLYMNDLFAEEAPQSTAAETKEVYSNPTKPIGVVYSLEEAMEKTTAYFNGDAMAADVWISKYALKDSDGKLYELTPEDMHHRIAREIARIEKRYPNPMSEQEVFELLKDFKYIIPQGSPMAGIGNNIQAGSLSNCFVIGQDRPADSYGGIMRIDQEQVQLMKRRGGVGHDLSHIRPKGSPVKNTALTSTGIVPFMERYSNSTREVAQDGRRGALMLSISVKHPDSSDFIDAKLEAGKVTGANISVKLTNDFMQAVVGDKEFTQKFPIDSSHPKVTKDIKARELWNKIIHNAWKSAEPGILFWDTIINESIPDCYADKGFKTVSTNPCGEIPLCPYDSCRLLAINLYSYVKNPFTAYAEFDYDLFAEHVQKGQRMMDDIIDLEIEKIDIILKKIQDDPEEEETKRVERMLWENIRRKALMGRRTGFGITAEGDMLAALGIRYGSDKGIEFAVNLQRTLALEAYRSSVQMARERKPFPIYNKEREKSNPLINRIKEADPQLYADMEKYGRRNISLLTIAPTGSVSICTQTTSGIEPVFSVSYKRRRKINPNDKNAVVKFTDEVGDTWEEYNVFHHLFVEYLRVNGFNVDEVIHYSDEQLKPIIEASPYHKATANDVDWVAKVKMQGAVQKWVDHSISVTVNIPNETPESMVSEIYKTAWESGCKGITVYRDGSRDGVLISNNDKKGKAPTLVENNAPPRPKILEAEVVRFLNEENERWVAVVGLYEGRPYEIFTGKAKGFYAPDWVKKGWVIKNRLPDGTSRYDFKFQDEDGYSTTMEGLSRMFDKEYWNYAKLISGILRHGMPLHAVVDLVSKLILDTPSIHSWKTGVERSLKKFIPDGVKPQKAVCEKCKQSDTLMYQEGCLKCTCGHTVCG